MFTPGNVALRLDDGYMGLDVDAHGEHGGEATLAAAIEKFGPLPPTWTSTSREGVSGIRIYRVPRGKKWRNNFNNVVGKGIDVIHLGHRYVMAAPSIHPDTGNRYVWIDPDGNSADGLVPETSDIPKLPKKWWRAIDQGQVTEHDLKGGSITFQDATQWVLDLGRDSSMCVAMKGTLRTWRQRVTAAGKGGFHDAVLQGVWAIVRDARDGHSGVVDALNKLKKTFDIGIVSDRDANRARLSQQEWERIVSDGVVKIKAEEESATVDPCSEIAAGRVTLKTGDVLELSEQGNAGRLADVADGRLLWMHDMQDWMVWREKTGMWEPDDKLQREQWAVDAVNTLLPHISDESIEMETRKAIKSHYRMSEKIGGIRATLEMYKGRPGCQISVSEFDTNPNILACRNGVIFLEASGPRFRHLLMRDDHVTLSTGVDFVASARSDLWDAYLRRVQPDEDVRAWLKRLAGYSLLGHNAARRMIVCLGPTSSGKGTFVDAMRAAVGGYAAVANLTIFRDNQDERPRADLASALPKRFIFCDEASFNWKLHPDQVKRMTGAGEISARKPFAKAAIHMRPAFTPWLMSNSVPHIEGADEALRRRLLVVPFSETISRSDEDVTYATRLRREQEAILAWAVAGYGELMSMGLIEGLATPPGAFAVTQQFTESMSNVDAFVAEMCIVGEGRMTTPRALADAFNDWQEEQRIAPRDKLSAPQFALQLHANGFPQRAQWVDGKAQKMRCGLELKQLTSTQAR
jgi:P4 family phage/plasmid primase-like protien